MIGEVLREFYMDMLWIVPTSLVITLVFVAVASKISKKFRKWVCEDDR